MPLPQYENAFRRHWQIKSADQQDDQTQDQTQQSADPNQMQTLKTGTAQQLCERLWKGFISNDMSLFSSFFQQVDQVATNFVQSLPVPPQTLDDADFSSNPDDLPSIGPSTNAE